MFGSTEMNGNNDNVVNINLSRSGSSFTNHIFPYKFYIYFENMSHSGGFNNVHFLGVARVAGQALVVASYSYNSETDLAGVKQVLEQPNMQLSAGKHYNFSVGNLAWHLIAGMLPVV
jgi:hypothetical protein